MMIGSPERDRLPASALGIWLEMVCMARLPAEVEREVDLRDHLQISATSSDHG